MNRERERKQQKIIVNELNRKLALHTERNHSLCYSSWEPFSRTHERSDTQKPIAQECKQLSRKSERERVSEWRERERMFTLPSIRIYIGRCNAHTNTWYYDDDGDDRWLLLLLTSF